jgi:hypothetical protein
MNGRNRYLVTRSGWYAGTRAWASLSLASMFLFPPVLVVIGALLQPVLGGGAIGLAVVLAFVVFFGGVVALWVFLIKGSSAVERAAKAWLGGDYASAIAACHGPLLTVFRADVRTKALHVLGLCAEANGDFAEAEDLFRVAYHAVPAAAAPTRKRHARVLMLSHRAIALVALGRIAEADAAVREASAMYPQMNRPGVLDAFTDDASWGMGPIALNTALVTLEPGRDPRAMLTLATVVLLAASQRPRDAIDVLERERMLVSRGLLPREQELLALADARSRALLAGGGPMRAAALATADATHPAAWARRVLPEG